MKKVPDLSFADGVFGFEVVDGVDDGKRWPVDVSGRLKPVIFKFSGVLPRISDVVRRAFRRQELT